MTRSLREERGQTAGTQRWRNARTERTEVEKVRLQYSETRTEKFTFGYKVVFKLADKDGELKEHSQTFYFSSAGKKTPAADIVLKKNPNARLMYVENVP